MTEEIVCASITEMGIFMGIGIGLIIFCILTTCLIINLSYSNRYKVDMSIALVLLCVIILISSGV